ncbi:HIT zinc finger family protein, partial [Aphelenchoides avenae]
RLELKLHNRLAKTILENLRNRFVLGHPEFIVALDNDFTELPTLSESEAQDLQTTRREEYNKRMCDHFGGGSDGPGANRGYGPPFRGGPSFHRGRGRGGGRADS